MLTTNYLGLELTSPLVASAGPLSQTVDGVRSLAASGVRLERDAARAAAVVRITRDEVKERVLSVSARNIPREYELVYRVQFSVQKGDAELLAPREATLARDFTFDETILLAKEREQRLLEDALARDLAAIVMRQLAAL